MLRGLASVGIALQASTFALAQSMELSRRLAACHVDIGAASDVVIRLETEPREAALADLTSSNDYVCSSSASRIRCSRLKVGACHSGCEWNVAQRECDVFPGGMSAWYVNPRVASPLDLFLKAFANCNNHSRFACIGNCKWNDKRKKCDVSAAGMGNLLCADSFGPLLRAVKQCDMLATNDTACNSLGSSCEYHASKGRCTLQKSSFAELAYGEDKGKAFVAKTRNRSTDHCQLDDSVCVALVSENKLCSQRDRIDCIGWCTYRLSSQKCEISPQGIENTCKVRGSPASGARSVLVADAVMWSVCLLLALQCG
eukprot:TRINITY_DN19162_c0_g4_i1.p1 TRINITY_DN19162_c0_g4~~TRINITY_DN19162_c0_g4_i1.p1  ORF type:complete len:313 (+),score=21.65 TRINITY_DN19162_c0_g4_i1:162-1100(+)